MYKRLIILTVIIAVALGGMTVLGYHAIGSKADAIQADRLRVLATILPIRSPGLTVAEISREWPEGEIAKPSKRTLFRDLAAGASEGRWTNTGTGKRNDPFKYHRHGGPEA